MRIAIAVLCLAAAIACGGGPQATTPPVLLIDDAVSAGLLRARAIRTDDFAWSGPRSVIRALVPLSRSYFYIDRTDESGLAYDAMRALALGLRAPGPGRSGRPTVVIIPTRHDRMLSALVDGAGDIALGSIAVTGHRNEQAVFSLPTISRIEDVIVTGPTAPKLSSIDDLSGQAIYVRPSSSAFEAVGALNQKLVQAGRPPARVVAVDDLFEDDDLLQLVDAGILPTTVVKDYAAEAMAKVFDRVVVRADLVIATGVSTVIAIRKDAPLLHQIIDDFVDGHKAGSTFGDALLAKHVGDVVRLASPAAAPALQRFRRLSPQLQKDGSEFAVDWQLIAAQQFEESGLGASDAQVRASAQALRAAIDKDYRDAAINPLNQVLFALAAHQAGDAAVAGWRRAAASAGLDPNVWFYNVEIISAHQAGRKTVDYVSNIYKYYTAYKAMTIAPAS
jgi:membrane-bound lytic murein transglycosylase MltF